MSIQNNIMVTTPIFYPSGTWHIGTAYTMVLTDAIRNALKIINPNTKMMCGVDEHGDKVASKAKLSGMQIEQYLHNKFGLLQELAIKLDIKDVMWSRTSSIYHHNFVKNAWNKLKNSNLLYEGVYEGYYSIREETFFLVKDLIEKHNENHETFYETPMGEKVQKIKQACWFLRTKDFIEEIRLLIPDIYPNSRKKEILSYLDSSHFNDLCISRQSGWGISIPDKESDEVIYVWLEALMNYLSVQDKYEWYADKMIHVMAKDIIKFHGIFWPYIHSKLSHSKLQLVIHNWWTINNHKLSKSFGDTIDPIKLIDKYGSLPIRFYLLHTNIISSDHSFEEDKIMPTFKTFMIDKFSNLVYRVWSIIYKNQLWNKVKQNTKHECEDEMLTLIRNNQFKDMVPLLFKWCNTLNSDMNELAPWNNLEHAPNIASLVYSLIQYFRIIDPSLPNIDFMQPPFKIYDIEKYNFDL